MAHKCPAFKELVVQRGIPALSPGASSELPLPTHIYAHTVFQRGNFKGRDHTHLGYKFEFSMNCLKTRKLK